MPDGRESSPMAMNIQLPDIKSPPNNHQILNMDSSKDLGSQKISVIGDAKRKFEQLQLKRKSAVGPMLKPTAPR